MKKLFLTCLSVVVLCLAILAGCTGFNGIMYDNLSDINSYKTEERSIIGVYMYDEEEREYVAYDKDRDLSVYLCVETFNQSNDTEAVTYIEIIPDNVAALEQNGFFEGLTEGSSYSVTWSDYIYMDTNFFYLIGVEQDGIVYLDSQVGLENMINFMGANKSFL